MDEESLLDELLDGSGEEVNTDEVIETSQENQPADEAETAETAPDTADTQVEPETDDNTQTAETAQESEESNNHTVPVGTLTAERKKAQERLQAKDEELARERAEFAAYKQQQQNKPLETQEPETPVDDSELMFEDPTKFKANLKADTKAEIMQEVRMEMRQEAISANWKKAELEHGTEYMVGITDELKQPANTNMLNHIFAQPDPVGAAIKWKQDQATLADIGGDAAAFREKIRAEELAKIRKEAGYTDSSGGQQNNDTVPSITDVPSAGGETVPSINQQEDDTFNDMFG